MTTLIMPMCECECGRKSDSRHHKLSQTKVNRGLYGSLIDDPRNLMWVCRWCHSSHASPKLIRWNEQEFAEALGITPRSKEHEMRVMRENATKEREA